jgi:hypothetical protein
MAKQILFFALQEDILSVLEIVETGGPIKYARMGGQFDTLKTFNAGAEIPQLGRASSDSSISCESFLVAHRETPIQLRFLEKVNNRQRFAVDQLLNPDTIALTPGGLWDEETVLNGRAATVSESQRSEDLMKRFQAAIKKNFRKIKTFYVGPQAYTLLEQGKRLTISAQSPREFDLKMAG